MRIISKFRDYYDGVMRTGMDKEVVYVREPKKIESDETYGINFSTDFISSAYVVDLVLLGYCGKFYKIYVVYNSPQGWRHAFHKYDEFENFMKANNFNSYGDFRISRWWPGRYATFAAFDPAKLVEIFHKYQTPLFTVSYKHKYQAKSKLLINLAPSLKDLAFQKVKDPYTTYQDIFQYVAGVLNHPENKMVKISDKDKIAKHGFDKWSFRQKGPKK